MESSEYIQLNNGYSKDLNNKQKNNITLNKKINKIHNMIQDLDTNQIGKKKKHNLICLGQMAIKTRLNLIHNRDYEYIENTLK